MEEKIKELIEKWTHVAKKAVEMRESFEFGSELYIANNKTYEVATDIIEDLKTLTKQ